MPNRDNPALVEMASELVAFYVAHNPVPAAELPGLLATVHRTLVDLDRPASEVAGPPKPVPPVPVRKSIGDDFIVSLEDGKRYQTLKRHLTRLGLTPDQYRAKWGLPPDYPMVAPAYARARSALAKSKGFGLQRRKR